MILDGYYGVAEIVTEHGVMQVWADLKIEADTVRTLTSDIEHPIRPYSWSGSVDNSLRGPIHPVHNCPAVLRLPDGREGKVYVGDVQLLVNEPVRWPVTGDGPAPFGNVGEATP